MDENHCARLLRLRDQTASLHPPSDLAERIVRGIAPDWLFVVGRSVPPRVLWPLVCAIGMLVAFGAVDLVGDRQLACLWLGQAAP